MGGDPAAVMRAPADWVQKMVSFVEFRGDYEDVYLEMNRGGKD